VKPLTIEIRTEAQAAEFYKQILDTLRAEKKPLKVELGTVSGSRTLKQNAALHLWCGWVAEALNGAGYDYKRFLDAAEYKLDTPWTCALVKDQLWRPVQEAMTQKESTTELNKIEPSDIHTVLMARLTDITGIPDVPWPRREEAA
jgi:hypothetical protein